MAGSSNSAGTSNGDIYERARHDHAFLHAIRIAHEGRWDALDALWWEAHPGETAPSGIPAPLIELRELQRRLFSAGGDAGGDRSTTETMRELEATIAHERRAIQDAVAQASAGTHRAPYQSDADVTTLFESTDPVGANTPTVRDVPPGAQPRTRNLAAVFGIVAALVVGLFAGTQLGGGTADAASPVTSASPTKTSTPAGALDGAPPAALQVFDRPQVPEDVPQLPMPAALDLLSFRAIGGSPVHSSADSQASQFGAVYAAKSTSGLICLLAVVSDADYLSTCMFERDFPITGMRLYWPGELHSSDESGDSVTIPMDYYTVWKPDGTSEGGGSGRP